MVASASAGEDVSFGAMSPKLADLAYLLGKQHGVDFNIVMAKGGKGVMNGLNADDLDVGWVAGIQSKAVASGEMVNLASGLSTKLAMSPDAPTMAELGVDFTADGYFVFVAPAGLPDEAREALASAIGEIVADPDTKAGEFVEKAFGGAAVINGDELDALMASEVTNAEALLAAASE